MATNQGAIVLVSAFLSTMIGCDRPKQTQPYGTEPSATPSTTAANPGYAAPPHDRAPTGANKPAVSFTDAQILGVMDVANSREIDLANVALKRTKNAKVKTFAKHVVDDHEASVKDFDGLAKTFDMHKESTDASKQLDDEGSKTVDDLKKGNDADFDRRYVAAQIKSNRDLLEMLDKTLVPTAQNAELKDMLKHVRDRVNEHLKMARDVETSLSKA